MGHCNDWGKIANTRETRGGYYLKLWDYGPMMGHRTYDHSTCVAL
jgi:hypothetical protein